MKKGIIATAILALGIGVMTVFLSMQLCNWVPSLKAACWVQEQVQIQHEVSLVHHSQMNTWHSRIDEQRSDLEFSSDALTEYRSLPEGMQDCELGKAAAYALGHGEEATALVSLESIALQSNCLEVRKAAVHAIEGFGSDEAREALTRILLATAR